MATCVTLLQLKDVDSLGPMLLHFALLAASLVTSVFWLLGFRISGFSQHWSVPKPNADAVSPEADTRTPGPVQVSSVLSLQLGSASVSSWRPSA